MSIHMRVPKKIIGISSTTLLSNALIKKFEEKRRALS